MSTLAKSILGEDDEQTRRIAMAGLGYPSDKWTKVAPKLRKMPECKSVGHSSHSGPYLIFQGDRARRGGDWWTWSATLQRTWGGLELVIEYWGNVASRYISNRGRHARTEPEPFFIGRLQPSIEDFVRRIQEIVRLKNITWPGGENTEP
jgi:hypothetical protein